MDPFEAALDDLKSQDPPAYRPTARKYGISHSALMRRHKGQARPRRVLRDDQAVLSKQQERDLIGEINRLSFRGIPPTKSMIKRFAITIAQKPVGKNWVYRFLKRHNDTLSSSYLKARDMCRKKADNFYDYSYYFELV
jgi:hypothetical protein